MKASDIEIRLPDTLEGKKAKEIFAVTLFNEGILSKSQASKLINMTIREFHEILLRRGIPTSGQYDKETTQDLIDVLNTDD